MADSGGSGGASAELLALVLKGEAADAGAVAALLAASPEAARVKDAGGFLPLHVAASSAAAPVVLAVLAAWPGGASEKNFSGRLALHLACGRADADAGVASALLCAHAKAAREKNCYGELPLHAACEKGAPLAVVALLLASHPDVLREKGEDGRLPLSKACRHKGAAQAAVVKLLLKHYPEATRERDAKGNLPLHAAASLAASPVVLDVLAAWPEGAREKSAGGNLALHLACGRPDADAGVVDALLAAHPEAARAKDKTGDFPLHAACASNAPIAIVRALVVAHQDALGEKGEFGHLPLHKTCGLKNAVLAVAALLLEHHPEAALEADENGDLPLHAAASHAPAPVAIAVLAAWSEGAREKGSFGNLALHNACSRADANADVVAALLAAHPGAALEKDGFGDLPLHAAYSSNAPIAVVRALLAENPAALSKTGKNGVFVLHAACGRPDADAGIVDALLAAHPEAARAKDKSGNLPLHVACANGAPIAIVRALLAVYSDALREKGSGVFLFGGSGSGKLPLQFACARGKDADESVIALLLEHHTEAARVKDASGDLPLHAAALLAPAPVVLALLAAWPESAREMSPTSYGGRIALHLACDRADADAGVVGALLAAHPDAVSTKDKDDCLPLHAAARSAPAPVVLALLAAWPEGAREKGGDSRFALHLACGRPDADAGVVDALLAAYPEAARAKDKSGDLPLHAVSSSNAPIVIVRALLAAHPAAVSEMGKNGVLVLHDACAKGKVASLDLVDALLAAHPEAASAKDKTGDLPLHTACATNAPLAVVRALLAAHADALHEKGQSDQLPLFKACWCNASLLIVELLLERHPMAVHDKDKNDKIPLHAAAQRCTSPVALAVLAAWPEGAREKGGDGRFALHLACGRPDADAGVVDALLAAYPEAARAKDKSGDFPLHAASSSNAPIVIVRALLAAHPAAVREAGNNGVLALHAVCSKGQDASLDLVDALLAAHPEAARMEDGRGDLPLHIACASSAPITIVRALLEAHPSAVRKEGLFGVLLLHAACAKGKDASLDLVGALLAAHPEAARAKDKTGDLPLHIACASNAPIAIVHALLTAHPAAVSEAGQNGVLVLHAACAKGKDASLDLVAALLAACPDAVHARNNKKQHALTLAITAAQPFEPVVRALLVACLSFAASPKATPWREAWVTFLHNTKDRYLPAIEAALDANIEYIEALAKATDADERTALDVAVRSVRALIQSRLYLLGRFELAAGVPEHASTTSVVRFATDHNANGTRVALKFMRHCEAFERELSARKLADGAAAEASSTLAAAPAVLPVIASFDGESDASVRAAFAARGLSTLPFLLVLPAADRSLAAVIDHERALASWPEECVRAARQVASALARLHASGVVHGDVKPRNVVRAGAAMVLIDMDAAGPAGAPVASKSSSAFAPPELARALIAAARPGREEKATPLATSPAQDAWAFGATLFAMLTGATLLHADAADNAVGGSVALAQLAEWSDASRAAALARAAPFGREACSLLSQLLQREPSKRPALARMLTHPYLSGRPAAGRLPGEDPRWDVFVSYRVASDSETCTLLVAALQERGLRVWSDTRLAQDSVGDSWRDAFCDALAASRVFVPIISRGAVNAGAAIPARHWPELAASSAVDNVLLEHRLALELRAQGMCAAVVPVLLGDALAGAGAGADAGAGTAAVGEREHGHFFAQGCAPANLPTVAVASVEDVLERQLDRLGLGAPLTGSVSVADVWKRVVGDHQGLATAGTLKKVLDAAAGAVTSCVKRYTPTTSAADDALGGLPYSARLAAALAERDTAIAERDTARTELDAALAALAKRNAELAALPERGAALAECSQSAMPR